MSFTETMVQRLAVVDIVHAANTAASTVNMNAVDTLYFNRLLYILDVGLITASSTINFQLQGSATSNGTFNNITGFVATQLTTANNIVKIGIKAEDLGSQTGGVGSFPNYGRFVRGQVVVGTAAANLCVVALGSVGRWKPENVVGSKEITIAQTISDSTNG